MNKANLIKTLEGIFGVAFLIAGAFALGGSVEGGILAFVFLFLAYIFYRLNKKQKKKSRA